MARAPDEFPQTVSATAVNSAISFGFRAREVHVFNDGTNPVHVTFASSVAVLTDFDLAANESFKYTGSPTEQMGLICDAAETATVRLVAWS